MSCLQVFLFPASCLDTLPCLGIYPHNFVGRWRSAIPCSCRTGAEEPQPPCAKAAGARPVDAAPGEQAAMAHPRRQGAHASTKPAVFLSSKAQQSGGKLGKLCGSTARRTQAGVLAQDYTCTSKYHIEHESRHRQTCQLSVDLALLGQLSATFKLPSPKPRGDKNNSASCDLLPPPTKKLSCFSCPLSFNQNNYLFFFKVRFGYI